jgi:hypothetical protein
MDTKRISAFPSFANLPPEELNEFAGAMREVEVEAGATVIRAETTGLLSTSLKRERPMS